MIQSQLQNDPTALFRKAWSLYDAITERNYMNHCELYAHVAERLRQRYDANASYSLLDLGCGNARFLAACLREAPPQRYEGVDLSAAALEEAHTCLGDLPNVTLHQQDMLEAAHAAAPACDVIFSGFAMHHLDAEAKQRLFHACAARLATRGCFILVDVMRKEEQTREDYLADYLHFMRTQWITLPPEHLEEACAHVATFDFPETLSNLSRMAHRAGFARTEVLAQHGAHHALCFHL